MANWLQEVTPMPDRPLLIVALAAGKGERMRSALPKVLHPIGGRSMLGHVISTAQGAGATAVALVVGPGAGAADSPVRAEIARVAASPAVGAPSIEVYEQGQQRGTADAVLAAREALQRQTGDVLVVYADTPLVETATLRQLIAALDAGAQVAVLAFEAADPTGYGRVIVDNAGCVSAIREHRDASATERDVRLCAAGAMAFRVSDIVGLLSRIGNDNAKGEYYLTDAIALASAQGLVAKAVLCTEEEAQGVNTREQLAAAEAVFQNRTRRKVMEGGATLIAPDTVWFSYDTVVGRDVTIEPNVFFGPGVTVEDGVQILANCHFTGARIRTGARVGPFARLRPGADIGMQARIGNFVEVKAATLEKGAKANHLAYIGDGRVGEGANIGAGTIFCNYDGYAKHFTDIGNGAFVGSNTSLVAPVKVGEGAYIGSGSVITKDVTPGALALERGEQQERPGWAAKFRLMMQRRKKSA
jgi:bifunctional UDP-N-acetylglucosamine pyrophosphorylase/glucosamine-1-phosphate N-acetyltransferase